MCGRFTATAAFDVLAERFGITVEAGANEELTARYNVAPSQTVPIITANGKGRRLVMAKWGFRPAWVESGSFATINARAETVATTRLFSAAVRDGRCLIPATGFYEWKPVPGQKRKQPYFIRLKGGAPFAFAGLWTPPHLAPPTCTIITTNANELLAPIHGRMPVILDPDDEVLWLDPGCVAPVKGQVLGLVEGRVQPGRLQPRSTEGGSLSQNACSAGQKLAPFCRRGDSRAVSYW